MRYLLDTDHITIVQRETGRADATLRARPAQHPPAGLALPLIRMDLRIAAIALALGLVVRRTIQDFGRVPGLQSEDWTLEGRLP